MKKYISRIKLENERLKVSSDHELMIKAQTLKKRAINTSLDNLMAETFALVQEVSSRKIGLRHFDTQLLAGIYLHNGKIVEMKTGEGKTLASTLPVALNAFSQKGVHVVTVNEYLAERDKNWMGKIYQGLGLSVGLVKSADSLNEKKKSYLADITYLTNSELVFDYLRDSTALELDEIVQRELNYCVIDEIDSILIDESRTPLILSISEGKNDAEKLQTAHFIANSLEKNLDFEIDEKRKEVNFTDEGYQKVTKQLRKKTLYDEQDPWTLPILNALKAKYFFTLNKDYIILDDKIVIVDEFTGRVMSDRRWSSGIHEAIEVKENVEVGQITKTKNSMTYQNFFPLYSKLSGMTGTAKTDEKEFKEIYDLGVVIVPPAKPMIRKDLADLIYKNEFAKWKAIVEKTKECFTIGQPLLIGTANVEKSEFLSEMLKEYGLPHQVLNAKPENIVRESEIVAQAGEPGSITIATNMAGRGTDILLGGNASFKVKKILTSLLLENKTFLDAINSVNLVKNISKYDDSKISIYRTEIFKEYETQQVKAEELKNFSNSFESETNNFLDRTKKLETDISNLPYSLEDCSTTLKDFYKYFYEDISKECEKMNQLAKNVGGLFVLGTERHETRRIDNQLRGRAGRQGDPGSSQFFLSLDDYLLRVFGGDKVKNMIVDLEQPLESEFLTKSLENAQKRVESFNYDIRKNIFDYDETLNKQRKKFFGFRKTLLTSNIFTELAIRFGELGFDKKNAIENQTKKTIDLEESFQHFSHCFKLLEGFEIFKNSKKLNSLSKLKNKEDLKKIYPEIWISFDTEFANSNSYKLGSSKNLQDKLFLEKIDSFWTEHIEHMNFIRETINWRAYGQQNPRVEYDLEAYDSYQSLLEKVAVFMLYYLLENSILKQF